MCHLGASSRRCSRGSLASANACRVNASVVEPPSATNHGALSAIGRVDLYRLPLGAGIDLLGNESLPLARRRRRPG
jgi:hypothetical protein